MDRSTLALELAHEHGFDLAGIAPLAPPPDAARFEAWLAAGHHGELTYLERFKERILDPRRIVPEGRSLLVLGSSHARPAVELAGGARVARYAAAPDYHNVLGRRLRRLGARLAREGFGEHWRKVVDAGPLLERSHASAAGLGFASKAANLLHPDLGPWFFLGELILDEELAPTPAVSLGSCGTCRACLDACPTGAIVAPGTVHAPDCISYQTIENPGSVPRALRPALGDWVFGCDVCSEVCPYGAGAPDASATLGTHAAVEEAREGGGPLDWLLAESERLAERLRGSPLARAGPAGLRRNAALFLGNRPSEAGRGALLAALERPEVPADAVAWALLRAHGEDAGVRAAVERAARTATDPERAAALTAELDHA